MVFGIVYKADKSTRAEIIRNVKQCIRSGNEVVFLTETDGVKATRIFDSEKVIRLEKETK